MLIEDFFETDVLVIGGGPAGIAAAVAAARAGVKTCLIERYGFLGGAATAGLVGPFMSCFSLDGKTKVVGGVFDEILDKLLALDGAVPPTETGAGKCWSSFITAGHWGVTPFDSELLKIAADELVAEAGVDVHFHTLFMLPIKAGNTAQGAIVATKSGFVLIKALVVIDASGDADFAARSGVPTHKGRSEDGATQPMTLFFLVGNVNDEKVEKFAARYSADQLFSDLIRKAQAKGEFSIPRDRVRIYRTPRPGVWRVNMTRLQNLDGTDYRDLTRAEILGRQQVLEVFRFLRKYIPGFESATLLAIAPQVGVRETRRIEGEYVLSHEDLLKGKIFEDAIACGGYPIDVHDPKGTGVHFITTANVYTIPYRCLLPKTIDNLLVAGRCISATHEALGAVRVMPICFATGQAAGTAAACSIKLGVPPRFVEYKHIKDSLLNQKAILPETLKLEQF